MATKHLSIWQRIYRRIALLGGSYTHPDGTLELDFEEKAGIDPRSDSEEVQGRKLAAFLHEQGRKELKGLWFAFGLMAGILLSWYFRIGC